MKVQSKQKGFTLLELVIALVVVAIGVSSTLVLMPIGLTKNRDTVATRSATDAADQFLNEMVADMRVDWAVASAFPDSIPTMDENQVVWSEQSLLPESNAQIRFSALNASDDFDPVKHQDGIFRVVQRTPENLVEFEAVIRSWREIEEIGNPHLNGDPMPFGLVDLSGGSDSVGFGYTNGEEYVLKQSTSGPVSPGNFGALNFSGAQGGGAQAYEGNIVNGGPTISAGHTALVETGNMVGKTISGMNARLEHTPYVRIPVIQSFPSGGGSVTVIQLLPFKILKCTGTGNTGAEVRAVYIGQDSSGSVDLGTAYRMTLKAEVSWPMHIPYANRKKAIFGLSTFKPGNISAALGIL